MVSIYSDRWNQGDRDIFKGIDHMIKARNAIVHGRLVDSSERLMAEVFRAQIVFEKLFMEFIGCFSYYSTGSAVQYLVDF